MAYSRSTSLACSWPDARTTVGSGRRGGTIRDGETLELETIANALRAISKEISSGGLAQALLKAALDCSGAIRGAVLLGEGGQPPASIDPSLPREQAKVFASRPPVDELRLPAELSDSVLARRETVVRHRCWQSSALIEAGQCLSKQEMGLLCLPLIHQECTFGLLYLEAAAEQELFTQKCVSIISMLAWQAAVSFESAQLFEALRETNMWMIRGQQIGRMGSYRWNTRTLLSRGSHEAYRIIGLDPNVNPVPFETFRDRIHPDDLPSLEEALADAVSTRSPFAHEYRVVHNDGTTLHVVAVGQFDVGLSGDLELEGIITDITEQKAAEQALADARADFARATRLASLGELAGSIIHEVNQPLTGIIASAEACLRWLTREPAGLSEARKSVMRITEQGLRASSVISGLRSLVRDGQLQFINVQIKDVVEEALLLLKRELERAGITLRTAFAPTPDIEADRVQLQQVVINLVRNAIDAMTACDGRPRVLNVSASIADRHVCVAVTDTGTGIDPMISERLFDPLYTTKGGGLGLGLSICRKIVTAHGGRLWVEKNTRNGVTFTFAVPFRRAA